MNIRHYQAEEVLHFAKENNISVQDAAAAIDIELKSQFYSYVCCGGLEIGLGNAEGLDFHIDANFPSEMKIDADMSYTEIGISNTEKLQPLKIESIK